MEVFVNQVQVAVQVEALAPGPTPVTITTETDRYNISSMATPAAHTPLGLCAGDVPVCVCVKERRSKRAEVVN